MDDFYSILFITIIDYSIIFDSIWDIVLIIFIDIIDTFIILFELALFQCFEYAFLYAGQINCDSK